MKKDDFMQCADCGLMFKNSTAFTDHMDEMPLKVEFSSGYNRTMPSPGETFCGRITRVLAAQSVPKTLRSVRR